ncbi:helix-turn-helix transcriptional regulator [Nesterenkonia sp. F]|uniref:helix-turn-helix domain-containing protein n=1 Tax=Nesterenkonia sp. F TaxID=795955 RepID=UPI000255D78B
MSLQPEIGFVPAWTQADRLRKAREVTGLTAAEFGREIGISRQSVGAAERGDAEPKRTTLMAWAMRSGVSLKWLETGEAPSPGGGDGASKKWAPRDSNPEPTD